MHDLETNDRLSAQRIDKCTASRHASATSYVGIVLTRLIHNLVQGCRRNSLHNAWASFFASTAAAESDTAQHATAQSCSDLEGHTQRQQ